MRKIVTSGFPICHLVNNNCLDAYKFINKGDVQEMQSYAQFATLGASVVKWTHKTLQYTKTIILLVKMIQVIEDKALFLEEANFRVEATSRLPSLETCYIGLQTVVAKCCLNWIFFLP